MKGQIPIFNSLHDQYKQMGLPVDLIDVQTDFTIFNLKNIIQNKLPYHAPVNQLNFFVFAFIKNGFGDYTIDDQNFPLKPGCIYFTNPGHFRSYVWTAVEEVYLITLSESFLKENVHAKIFEEFPFLLVETFPVKALSPEMFAEFESLYLQIQQEFNKQSPYRNRIIGSLFVVLLLKIKKYFWLDYNPINEGNRGSLIVKNFKYLLEKHYRELTNGTVQQVFRVQDYAEAQNLHPNYLSNVIKTKTGKAIGVWIAEKTITEARSLLRHSPISVKEIAYLLGFSEATHFSNYFKKHTTFSPLQYRKQHQLATS